MRYEMAAALGMALLATGCGTLGSTRTVESLPCPPSPLPPPPPVFSQACLERSDPLPISPQILDSRGLPNLELTLKARVLMLQQEYADLASKHDACVDSHEQR